MCIPYNAHIWMGFGSDKDCSVSAILLVMFKCAVLSEEREQSIMGRSVWSGINTELPFYL